MKRLLRALLAAWRRVRPPQDIGPYIPHGPTLPGVPSEYVEPPLEPMGEWPGHPQDPDSIPPHRED